MKEFLKSIGITEETLKRALRTFVQAAIAYIVANIAIIDFNDKSILKSAVIGLITSALAAGIAAVMNLEKPEQKGGGSTLKFYEWVKVYLGKKTDWDGAYGVQCVDLIDAYIEKVLDLNKGFWGNAKYWWLNRNQSAWLKNNFDFITPTYKNGELQAGDIGIRTSGTYGHIFVVSGPTANGKIKYYDQNAGGKGEGMTLREKPYTKDYINGVLRPKNQSNLVKEKSKVKKYGNGAMLSAQTVYADSDLTLSVGSVAKGERVKSLGTGEGNPIIAYKTSSGYKVGFIKKSTIKMD